MAVVAVPPVARADCTSWPAVIEADTVNLAYPDTSATYWLTRFAAVPGARLRIDGQYPAARYFSFHAYDEAQRPVGALADFEIAANEGSENPFSTPGAVPGGSYTAFVEFTEAPSEPATNALYAGAMSDGSPNPMGTIIYRVYVSDDPAHPAGSVGLPTVRLQVGDALVDLPFEQCDPLPPSSGGPLTSAIRESSFPDEAPRALPWPPAEDPPRFVKFYSLSANVLDRLPSNPATDPVPRDTSGGFLSNQHINYLFALTARTHGELFVMRAKMPTAPDTRRGGHPTAQAQTRYWSVCQNSFTTQRFVACLADFEIEGDAQGWFTLVVSDPTDKPDNAVNWLPWGGPHYDGNVIYRHMLPAADFEGAIQNIGYGDDPATLMGEYFPEAGYCDRTTFEADPGACFAG
jgi:hypothetical protein